MATDDRYIYLAKEGTQNIEIFDTVSNSVVSNFAIENSGLVQGIYLSGNTLVAAFWSQDVITFYVFDVSHRGYIIGKHRYYVTGL